MAHDLIAVGAHSFAVLTERASAERDQLEITLAGGQTVVWGERYRDRLWLWTASGRQIGAHTLGAPLALPGTLNPVVSAAAAAAVLLAESRCRHDEAKAA